MNGDVKRCMGTYRGCMVTYSGVLRCAGLYGDVWQCMGIRVWWCTGLLET